MGRRGIARAGTGLAAGALLTAPLLGVLALGSLVGIPMVPYTVFEWLVRVIPGRVVTFGLDLTLWVLEGLGFDISRTAKTAQQVLALASLFVVGLIIGLLFFVLVRTTDHARIKRYGLTVGAALGLFSVVVTLSQGIPASLAGQIGFAVWVLALFLLWGWGLARLYLVTSFAVDASPIAAESTALTSGAPRRQAALATDSEAEARTTAPDAEAAPSAGDASSSRWVGWRRPSSWSGPVWVPSCARRSPRDHWAGHGSHPLSQRGVGRAAGPRNPTGIHGRRRPLPGGYRPSPPRIHEAAWRLVVDGLVATPLSLRLDEIKSDHLAVHQFVTLACISNPLGGPLISTTLWTGVTFRDVLAQAEPAPGARYVYIDSADGYHEEVDLGLVNSDPRIMLVYAWDGEPLPAEHGFPLRIFIPDLYGMKQPKWITGVTVTADSKPGYWVTRGWDPAGEVKTTSVIDTVATKSLVTRDGQTYVPIGGIAHAGAKGISKIEVQIDDGPWQLAEVREPLSELTWVIWRYDWPFSPGTHRLAVRAYDGQGRLQVTEETVSQTGTAVTGLYSEQRTILPLEP